MPAESLTNRRMIFVLATIAACAALWLGWSRFAVHDAAPRASRISAPAEPMHSEAVPSTSLRSAPGGASSTGATRSVQPLKVVEALPLPPLHSPLVANYRELKARAQAGDASAACRLAFELSRCGNLKSLAKSAASADRTLASASLATDPNRQGIEELARWRKRQFAEASEACTDFVADTDERPPYEYLAQAAAAGHLPSMLRFVVTPMMSGLKFSPLETADGWQFYQQQAPHFMEMALGAGAPEAYERRAFLALYKPFGFRLYPEDPATAIAYYLAVKQQAAPEYARALDDTVAKVVKDYKLTEADVSRASARAYELSKKIQAPDLGIDFSKGTFPNQDGSHCGAQ